MAERFVVVDDDMPGLFPDLMTLDDEFIKAKKILDPVKAIAMDGRSRETIRETIRCSGFAFQVNDANELEVDVCLVRNTVLKVPVADIGLSSADYQYIVDLVNKAASLKRAKYGLNDEIE